MLEATGSGAWPRNAAPTSRSQARGRHSGDPRLDFRSDSVSELAYRDAEGNRGPYEESLMANPVADPEKPLEVLRTIHSFDPCLACAIHTTNVEGKEISRIQTL